MLHGHATGVAIAVFVCDWCNKLLLVRSIAWRIRSSMGEFILFLEKLFGTLVCSKRGFSLIIS